MKVDYGRTAHEFDFEGGYDCIATGHNLDDEVAALFGNVLAWDAGGGG